MAGRRFVDEVVDETHERGRDDEADDVERGEELAVVVRADVTLVVDADIVWRRPFENTEQAAQKRERPQQEDDDADTAMRHDGFVLIGVFETDIALSGDREQVHGGRHGKGDFFEHVNPTDELR